MTLGIKPRIKLNLDDADQRLVNTFIILINQYRFVSPGRSPHRILLGCLPGLTARLLPFFSFYRGSYSRAEEIRAIVNFKWFVNKNVWGSPMPLRLSDSRLRLSLLKMCYCQLH
jgi:hypothetical protein